MADIVKVKWVKNNDFRTVLATGVFGGIGSNGLYNMNFFTDRPPLPEEAQDGSNAVREVHFGVLMNINDLKIVINWLQENINNFEDIKRNA